jgi:non-canonical purine NTP pyrophosphatase (RdgB/HAM1 family)
MFARAAAADSFSAMRLPVVFVTSRPEKAEEARRLGFVVERLELELPERQALDPSDVVEHKAREAFSRLERPVLVEDSGLAVRAWGGFPGALVKWLEKSAGIPAIPRMLSAWEDRRATACCVVGYFDGASLVTGRGECEGTIVFEPRGEDGFGWDSIFAPEGSDRTFAEMGAAGKDRVSHRRRAWDALASQMPAGLFKS